MESSQLSQSLQQLQSTPLDELERQIALGERAGDLRAVLGDELAAELEQMARAGSAQVLSGEERPLVVVLPGIIGSSLMNVVGDIGAIWLNPLALLAGKMRLLQLDADGVHDASPLVQIVASGLIPTHYLPIQLYLKTLGGCDVLGFPYDWRRAPDAAVEALRQLVVGQFEQSGRKAHLVGHSMGGVVARNFCLRYPAEAARSVAQLIQLGSPNYGSCEPIRNLTVGSDTGRLAEKLNPANAPLDLMRTCPGLYAMLPAPVESYPKEAPLPYPYAGDMDCYQAAAYGTDKVRPAHIQAARQGYAWLAQAGELPVPATIIAGYDRPTCLGVTRVDGDPGFDFAGCTGADGDGTVPLASATALPGMARLYARGVQHGDLPRSLGVQRAVRALIVGEEVETLEHAPYSMVLGEVIAEPSGPQQPPPGTLSDSDLDAAAARIRAGQAAPADLQLLAGGW